MATGQPHGQPLTGHTDLVAGVAFSPDGQLPLDRQQATEQRVEALLAAASPGEPEDPVTWAGYAQLAPHVLAIAPLGDSSPASDSWSWAPSAICTPAETAPAAEPVGEPLLDRWRSILGPDHPDTLATATRLTVALVSVGKAEPARALGEDTLQRCRRVLGSNHPVTLYLTRDAGIAHLRLGGGAAADRPSLPL